MFKCRCGVQAISFISKRENENMGKKFYTCKKRACKYFLWEHQKGSLSCNSIPSFNIEPSKIFHIYTDGSCIGNSKVTEKSCPSGWGIVVLADDPMTENARFVVDQLYGPVILDKSSPYFMGATVGSNNTSELTAIGEALLWLTDRQQNPCGDFQSAIIHYDSEYAAKSVLGEFNGPKNKELYLTIRGFLKSFKEQFPSFEVSFQHVKGHSNDRWNDLADELANRGSSGQTCRSGRYASVPGASRPAPQVCDLTDDGDCDKKIESEWTGGEAKKRWKRSRVF